MMEGVEIYRWTEPGYRPLVFSDGWMVALLNWEPIMDFEKATEIERHKETDEVFILLKGQAAMYVDTREGIQVFAMQPGVIYNVTKSTWHNLIATRDVAFLIVENRDTHLRDTETRKLSPLEREALKSNLPSNLLQPSRDESRPGAHAT